MRQLILISILFSASVAFSQNPVGNWYCQVFGIQMTLNQDGTYAMAHPGGNSQGHFQITGNQLWMKDLNAAQAVGYYAGMTDNNHLTLTDGAGTTMIFERVTAQPVASETPKKSAAHGNVLKEKNGLKLTEGHFNVGIGLTEFILGHKVSDTELNDLKKQLLIEFEMSPAQVIQQVDEIDQALRKLGTLTDPIQIGVARQQLYSALYLSTIKMKEHEKPLIIQVLNRYFNVLAVDEQNKLVLTDKDAEGMMNYLAFLNGYQGGASQLGEQNRQQFVSELVTQFASMTVEQKQVLCSASLLWKTIETNWNSMNAAQQQQFQSSLMGQMSSQGVSPYQSQQTYNNSGKSMADMQAEFNAKQNMFQMMNNMNLQSHATSLNIIENMGGSGNYWEVTDKPYWMNY